METNLFCDNQELYATGVCGENGEGGKVLVLCNLNLCSSKECPYKNAKKAKKKCPDFMEITREKY